MKNNLKIEFQYFSGCPHASLLKYRMYEAINELQNYIDCNIKETLIETNEEAQKINFRGSPTILINNVDLEKLPQPDKPSLSCRYYPDGLPSTDDIKNEILKYLS